MSGAGVTPAAGAHVVAEAGDLALLRDRSDAEQLAARVATIYENLRQQPGLAPSIVVDRLFTELVGLCEDDGGDLSARAARVLSDERVASRLSGLHEVCAEGEYLMEIHWSRRIAVAEKPREVLEHFPYLGNYRELTRLEINLLRCFGVEPSAARRICFLGAGPLPLSAVCLHEELGVMVDVVDRSAEAVALGAACVNALLGHGAVRFHQAEAAEFEAVAGADVVVLGALAGLDPAEKNAILAALRQRLSPGAVLLVRSAAGLRRLLYPAVGTQELSGWEKLGVLHPLNDVINSVIVLRRP
ncbi:nicotianamine synthase family protein [Kineosporia succinea]|uniref:Nicotianamine synthase n=1 Tax=Kineosporia succinea TaxID=84632 RepID=A0ABT9P7J5_9ACTN|nr:nicotianamine synthase family protein [Kineosporia succinea]MDP9828672.1 nicotianamine synthase [Kineosporia succinea]